MEETSHELFRKAYDALAKEKTVTCEPGFILMINVSSLICDNDCYQLQIVIDKNYKLYNNQLPVYFKYKYLNISSGCIFSENLNPIPIIDGYCRQELSDDKNYIFTYRVSALKFLDKNYNNNN